MAEGGATIAAKDLDAHERTVQLRLDAMREIVDLKFAAAREITDLKIAAEREARHLVEVGKEDSRALQATENLRRLTELNHAHEQIKGNQAESVRKETYESDKKQQALVNAELKDFRSNTMGKNSILGLVAMQVLVVIYMILRDFLGKG